MKNYYLLIVLIGVFISCNTNNTKESEKANHTDSTATVDSDTAAVKKDSHYFWSSNFDNKGLIMVRTRPLPDDSLTTTNIIQMMNEIYPEIKVEFNKTSNDTIFINIPNSTYLTQQAGSSGPEVYFAELTYNLTELKNINYVNIKFKKGDHASPGTFTRTYFLKQ